MKSKILLIVTIVLVIGVAVAVFLVIDASGTKKELTEDKESLTDQLDQTKADLEDSQGVADTLTDENATLTDEKTSLTSELEELTKDKDNLSASLDKLQSSYDDLLGLTFCPADDFPEVDFSFSSNEAMQRELEDFVEEMFGTVTDWSWFTWTDTSDTALHSIEASGDWEYFLVFYDDSSSGTVDGVFYVRGQCWLSLPSYEE